MAQQHLRNILACLDVFTLGQPEVFMQMKEGLFDTAGHFGIAGTQKFMEGWMDHCVSWIKGH
jgi:chromate reductase